MCFFQQRKLAELMLLNIFVHLSYIARVSGRRDVAINYIMVLASSWVILSSASKNLSAAICQIPFVRTSFYSQKKKSNFMLCTL